MKVREALDMLDYNCWANHRLLEMTEKVTSEQFNAPTTHSFSTLHATLVHIMDTEWYYRILLETSQDVPGKLEPEDFLTLEAIQLRWRDEEAALRAYLAGLRDEDLEAVARIDNPTGNAREYTRWHLLYDVINHGMQHRSEAAHMLTMYGQSPGAIDFSIFLKKRAQAKES